MRPEFENRTLWMLRAHSFDHRVNVNGKHVRNAKYYVLRILIVLGTYVTHTLNVSDKKKISKDERWKGKGSEKKEKKRKDVYAMRDYD